MEKWTDDHWVLLGVPRTIIRIFSELENKTTAISNTGDVTKLSENYDCFWPSAATCV